MSFRILKGAAKKLKHFGSGIYYGVRDRKYSNKIILIYSMGKVGSSSVFKTLNERLPATPIFHTHFLSDQWLNQRLPAMPKDFHHNIRTGNGIRKFINQRPKSKIKIVTLVREPISRAISNIFENWSHRYNDIDEVNVEDVFLLLDSSDHEYTLNWFNSEFKEFLGFDIFQHPFDKKRGWQVYESDKFEILCIKLESLNEEFRSAIASFLEVDVPLSKSNLSSEKTKGSNLFQQVKNSYKVSKGRLNELYSSTYVKHFYTEEEIKYFKKKWEG